MRLRQLLLALGPLSAAVASFIACNSHDLDLGDNGDASTASKSETSEAEGDDETWSGHIENYTFPSGSDSLVLTLTRDGDGGVTGHARFGSAPLYPPATDPHVGYPFADGGSQSLEGFRYTLHGGTLDGPRLRATVDSGELYAGWCALQTPAPYSDHPVAYWCLPEAGLDSDDIGSCFSVYGNGAALPINCAWAALCGNAFVCTCTASGCTSTAHTTTSFDFRFDGVTASGSVEPFGQGPYNIKLEKQ